MKHLLTISEDEKSRILNMHESATKKQYLKEQADDNQLKIWQNIKNQFGKYKPKSDFLKQSGNLMYGTNPLKTYSQETISFTIPSLGEIQLTYPYSETEGPDYESNSVRLSRKSPNGEWQHSEVPLNLQTIMSKLK